MIKGFVFIYSIVCYFIHSPCLPHYMGDVYLFFCFFFLKFSKSSEWLWYWQEISHPIITFTVPQARKRLAHEAAEAAAHFTAQIVTDEHGEIIINRDFEFHFECEETKDTPISVEVSVMSNLICCSSTNKKFSD